MNIPYIRSGDYFIPDLKLTEKEKLEIATKRIFNMQLDRIFRGDYQSPTGSRLPSL